MKHKFPIYKTKSFFDIDEPTNYYMELDSFTLNGEYVKILPSKEERRYLDTIYRNLDYQIIMKDGKPFSYILLLYDDYELFLKNLRLEKLNKLC